MTIIIGARLCDDLTVMIGDQLISSENGPLSEDSKEYSTKVEVLNGRLIGTSGWVDCCSHFLEKARMVYSIADIHQVYEQSICDFLSYHAGNSRMQYLPENVADEPCGVLIVQGSGELYLYEVGRKPALVSDYAFIGVGEVQARVPMQARSWKEISVASRFITVLESYRNAIMKNLYCDGNPSIYFAGSKVKGSISSWDENKGILALRLATCPTEIIGLNNKIVSIESLLDQRELDEIEFSFNVARNAVCETETLRYLFGFMPGKSI